MAMFTDTITLFSKVSDREWNKTIVKGVQWSDKANKQNNSGQISVARYASITFPEGTYENLNLNAYSEEDCIFLGEINEEISAERGDRISDLLNKYPRSGIIQSVNDNSNRDFLKNVKVVIG